MKWFKHETSAHTNLKLQGLIEVFGMEGYGYYWACTELVGLQSIDYRLKSGKNWKIYLKKQTNIPIEKQDSLLNFFSESNLIDKKALQKGDLFIPKLQERSDDYTNKVRRKYGQDTDNVPLEENRRDNKRIEEIILPDWLNKKAWEAWEKYKKERKQTLKPFTVKMQIKLLKESEKDHVQIIKNSITNGWTGLFPLNKGKKGNDYQKRIQESEDKREYEENEKNNGNLRILSEQSKLLASKMQLN